MFGTSDEQCLTFPDCLGESTDIRERPGDPGVATENVIAAREALGRHLRDLRQTAGYTQQQLADLLGYSRPRVAGAEKGDGCAFLFWQGCDKILHAHGALIARYRAVEALRQQEADAATAAAQSERTSRIREQVAHLPVSPMAGTIDQEDEVTRRIILGQCLTSERIPGLSLLTAAEAIRREIEDTLASGTVSPARLDRIEETVASHIRAYTKTPPANALAGLLVDFTEVRRLCAERQPAMIQARLSEIASLLATLAADSLMKLGRIADARAWYGTARIAADDSGNRELRARVRAQEAMLPYYYGDPAEAVRLARNAQSILEDTPQAAGALAAAAEARALARQGFRLEAYAAISRSRDLVERVGEPDNNEAFRFGERRLLFYESSTFSNAGDSSSAGQAQERALALYGDEPGLIDPALIRLDQAQLLIHEGALTDGCDLTRETCLALPSTHRTLIFAVRIKQIATSIPSSHTTHQALSELHQGLAFPNQLEAG